MEIRLTKLEELKNALHPNNIEEGYSIIREVDKRYFKRPQLNKRFNVGSFSTSAVQEIIDKSTFKTYSSIYRWVVIEKMKLYEGPRNSRIIVEHLRFRDSDHEFIKEMDFKHIDETYSLCFYNGSPIHLSASTEVYFIKDI